MAICHDIEQFDLINCQNQPVAIIVSLSLLSHAVVELALKWYLPSSWCRRVRSALGFLDLRISVPKKNPAFAKLVHFQKSWAQKNFFLIENIKSMSGCGSKK